MGRRGPTQTGQVPTSGNDYRVGFEALDAEVDDVKLEVHGVVPDWLSGTLVRNGPGRWTARPGGQGERGRHWFDGLAMLHRFGLARGRVRYASRYVHSPAWRAATEQGRFGYAEVGTNPTGSLFQRLGRLARPPQTGTNASVNVLRLGGRHVAVTETPDAIPFDPLTLETLDPIRYADDLPGDTFSAHPHHDAERGSMINIGVEYGRRSRYHVYELPDDSLTRRLVASVDTDQASYLHSFALTPRFVILVEYPLVADPLALLVGRTILDSYRWRPGRGTRFTVVERATGAVVSRTRTEAFFCYHQVNAFEDGDELVVDLPAMPGEQGLRQFLLSELLGTSARTPAGELRRYRVPLDRGAISYRLLSSAPIEFPRIAYEQVAGRPYRYVFGTGTEETRTTSFADRLVKIDVETGAVRTWSAPGCFPGEPIPVAPQIAPGGPGPREDDGVLLTVVLDAVARRSFLLVLSADTLAELARVPLPHAVPYGFHGQWFGTS